MTYKRLSSAVAATCLALLVCQQAFAQEKLRVGKAVAEAFAFLPLDVGVREGIFKRHGLDVEITAFGGRRTAAASASG
jgi:ABC-type nitrate/sulfonate/bicarbonate transport system substrate-binding protein